MNGKLLTIDIKLELVRADDALAWPKVRAALHHLIELGDRHVEKCGFISEGGVQTSMRWTLTPHRRAPT